MDTLPDFLEDVKKQMQACFDEDHLTELAKDTQFIQRATNRIQPIDFVQLMVLEMLEDPRMSYEALCQRLEQLNPESAMSAQALQQRVHSEGAVTFLTQVLQETLTLSLKPLLEETSPELLAPFSHVWIQDSTYCQLNQRLADAFRGTGGSASKASLKLDLVLDQRQHQLHQMLLTDSKTSDTTLAQSLHERLAPTDLVLRDLGYLSLAALASLQEKQAYYLSRLSREVGVRLDPAATQPMDLASYLDKHFPEETVIDLDVFLGEDRLPSRLIVYRAPEEVVNQRRQQAHRNAHKKNRKPTDAHLRWLAFSCYITHVARDVWLAEVVGTLYRLRWQVELTFKQWKSLLGIDVLKGTHPNRIRCLVLGRLIAIVLISMVHRGLVVLAYRLQREASATKLIGWLRRRQRLADAIRSHALDKLFEALQRDATRWLCKQRRTRSTTQQRIQELEPFGIDQAEWQHAIPLP